MNYGIITSFVVGGLFMLTVLAFNISLNSTTQEATLTTINQEKFNTLADIISYDINRMGFNADESVVIQNPIQTSTSKEVEFYVSSTGIVRWYADTSDEVTSTSNPDDYYLYREDEFGETSKFPVTNFNLKYFTEYTGELSTPSTLSTLTDVQVQVELIVESAEAVQTSTNSTPYFHRAVWQRTFTPTNVNIKQW